MLNFYDIKLGKTTIHRVGNKALDGKLVLSENSYIGEDDDDLHKILLKYFLDQFKEPVFYAFTHPSDLQLNDVYSVIAEMFDSRRKFQKGSKDLAKILYDCSDHPRIKSGEFYVAYFKDCVKDDIVMDAIGIFKSENEQTFLQVAHDEMQFQLTHLAGISTQKLDKGALILNVDKESGYSIATVDNLNHNEAKYWREDFLKLTPKQDDYNFTKNMLNVTKEFVAQLPDEFEISKAGQIDLLNKSLDFFKSNDNFKRKEFEKLVFEDKEMISSFRKFDGKFRDENELGAGDDFVISGQAVKKHAKNFKSIIKLDKNFHVYIHGDSTMIEKGVERDGRKFYKIYYKDES